MAQSHLKHALERCEAEVRRGYIAPVGDNNEPRNHPIGRCRGPAVPARADADPCARRCSRRPSAAPGVDPLASRRGQRGLVLRREPRLPARTRRLLAHDYDWRKAEAAINAYEHYRVEVEGVPVHFMRKPGVGPNPTPLILTHGWPWTFWHWFKVIDPLADPGAHGGAPAEAFDVIVPSFPGFVDDNQQ